MDEGDLLALRVCAIIQVCSFCVFSYQKDNDFQTVMAGFGALGFLCGKIFPAKPAEAKVAEEEAREDAPETAEPVGTENDGNKKASNSFSFSSLLGLIAAICGVVSLYADSTSIHLYRTYQTFIALSLIGLIPVSHTISPF